jgi:hypothetical protein
VKCVFPSEEDEDEVCDDAHQKAFNDVPSSVQPTMRPPSIIIVMIT